MKKSFILIAVVILLTSFVSDETKLKVELSQQEWGAVLQVIDQSNAPHAQVKAVQEIIIKQLQSQVDTNTKK